ncbi:receptor-like protein EIX2 [Cucumis sativus]|uniref:Serine/threonine-protein kinase bri1 n=1 Tax=Cucumis sativus TaxID=3659 RepID=A0A0A0KL22_CUCSA|nr:receptor-like protein EIX2 [Cucumis sativus]KGN50333.1 hypothetical protein Csa_000023 [Cucumis sativus]
MRKLVSNESSVVVLWMMMLLLLLQFCFSITAACIQKEREALLRFKNSFYEDPFHRLASWNGTDCCNWNGVGCNQTTGYVTIIDLRQDYNQVDSYESLSSNFIDSSLLELKYLNHLDLSGNYFNHTQIPNFLGSMLELTYLNLSRTSLIGKIPPHLGNLSKLEILDLDRDYYEFDATRWVPLNGDIEWISHLSSLHTLHLSGMNFSNAINLMQVISSLPSLSSLRLRSCSLQNNDFSLGSWLNYSSFISRVQLLDLHDNQLSGQIPTIFQNMTSLKYLDLSLNNFTAIFEGGISTFIENNCGLKVLDLSLNFYFGTDDVFESSYENETMGCDLQVLNLRYTSLKTKIPNWLEKLKNLQTIDLQSSQIYGLIPTSLGNLSNLKYLDLSINNLTGTIPASFERLLNLEVLDVSENSLKGVLTEASFANLYRLHTLNLGYNENLSLEIKANWNPPFQLLFFDASRICCFGSEFPQWLQTQKALVGLSLSNTNLSISSIPTWFTPQNLITLNLSNNQIMGPLPTNIGDQMPKLQRLRLNDNLIDGSLPRSICRWKNLNVLNLSNNRLSGMIEGCFLNPNLYLLDLSSNNFSGIFPYSHENLSYIEQVYLRNNNFEGSMPIVLKNAKSLEILDLTGNKFSGTIPTWVGENLESLQFLILRDNLFNINCKFWILHTTNWKEVSPQILATSTE